MLCYFVVCYGMLWYVMVCYAMLCYGMLWYVMVCCGMLWYVCTYLNIYLFIYLSLLVYPAEWPTPTFATYLNYPELSFLFLPAVERICSGVNAN